MAAAALIGPTKGGSVFRLPRLRVTRLGDFIPPLLGLKGGEVEDDVGLEGKEDGEVIGLARPRSFRTE